MDLRRIPPAVLVALGLEACADTGVSTCLSMMIPTSEDDGSSGASDDTTAETESDVGPCLGQIPTTDDGEVGPCLDTSGGCLSPPLDTSTSDGGFISTSSESSGDSGTGSSGSGSGSTDDGSSGSTSDGVQDASPRARAWHDALAKIERTLPDDVVAKLRAQKGPR